MDHELRRLLARKEPSHGFVERVVAATNPAASPRIAPRERRQLWGAGLAVAASLLLAIGGSRMWSEQQAIRRAERTERDVVTALRLTGDKLNELHERLTALSARKALSHDNQRQ